MTGVCGSRPAADSAPPAASGAAPDVAHDFNNLLCTINNHASLIMDDLEPQDPRYESAVEIRVAARLAAELVDRLLAAGRPVAAVAPTVAELAGNETVLLVESDAKMLKTAAGLLARYGYTVLPASTPAAAGRLAVEHPGDIHLLLAAGWLPEARARELSVQLAAQRPGLKMLLVSGDEAGGDPAGVARLRRPLTTDRLLRAIRALLDAPQPLQPGPAVSTAIGVVAARQRAEAAVWASEEKFARSFQCAPLLMTISSAADGTYLEVNERFVAAIGLSRAEIIGRTSVELGWITAADRDRLVRQLREQGRVGEMELQLQPRNKPPVWCSYCGELVTIDGQVRLLSIATDITARKRAEERLERINACLLGLGPDFAANINRLTALCGELLGATCALYNRLDGGMLCALGQWHTPPDLAPRDRPDGHICHDVIRRDNHGALVVRNLSATAYAASDPNVVRYNLQTYVGHPVCCAGQPVGSLCVVFQHDLEPTEDDLRVLGIVASSLGIEEERRAAATALRESELLYRQLFENMRNGFAYCRILLEQGRPHDFVYVQTNRAFEALTGLHNVAGRKVSEVIPGILEADPELIQIYGRVALTGKSEIFEIFLKSLDMWFAVAVYCPEREHFVAVFDVITKRKRAEAALRESEVRYKALFTSAVEGILVADVRTKQFRYANPAICRMFGHTEEEFPQLSVEDIYPPESLAHVLAEFEALARGEKTLALNLPCRRKDGATIWCDISTTAMLIDGHKCNVGFFTDVTERKLAAEARRRTEMRTREMIENIITFMPEGLLVFSDKLAVVRRNKAFRDIVSRYAANLGYTEAELERLILEQIAPGLDGGIGKEIRIPRKNGTESSTQ